MSTDIRRSSLGALAIGASSALVVACAAPHVAPPPPKPVVAPLPAERCAGPAEPLEAMRARAESTMTSLRAAGWSPSIALQPKCEPYAAIVATRAAPSAAMRLVALAPSQSEPATIDARALELLSAEETWDLRGDGGRAIVARVHGCTRGCVAGATSDEEVLELVDGAWIAPRARPRFPSTMRDDDGDGIPEFETVLVRVHIADCLDDRCGPTRKLEVDVTSLEAFDGNAFVQDLRAFLPLYRARLLASRQAAARLGGLADKESICPLEAIRTATEIDLYARILGAVETDALAEADAAMHGFTTAPCEDRFHAKEPYEWSTLRYTAMGAKVPRLSRGTLGGRLGDH